MKKNLITVIILALVLVNLVLTAILTFTIIPQTKKSNALIDQVCSAINLELEGGQDKDVPKVPIEDQDVYDITDSFTVVLKDSGDGKQHHAIFSVGLTLNKESTGYKKKYKGQEGLSEKETIVRSKINAIVGEYTIDEFKEDGQKKIKDEILLALQEMFEDPDYIIDVNFPSVAAE